MPKQNGSEVEASGRVSDKNTNPSITSPGPELVLCVTAPAGTTETLIQEQGLKVKVSPVPTRELQQAALPWPALQCSPRPSRLKAFCKQQR